MRLAHKDRSCVIANPMIIAIGIKLNSNADMILKFGLNHDHQLVPPTIYAVKQQVYMSALGT